MEETRKRYIKYLGCMKPLDEIVSAENKSESELFDEISRFYIRQSKQVTQERMKFYQEMLKVKPRSIKIEKINNRWGSCNSKREITYHYLIATLPMELIDYIVVHELCHIHHMNHDRSFWRKVGSIIPDYKERMKKLEGKEEF
ncbi:MAG: M48 family metallopeptidase [Clostridia bacterium]|nr:M48 family metallopeptidase [Clostridia bacterium]